MDGRFRLTRLVRTHSSEIYLIWEEENRVAQLDLHYAHDTIHATLILESDLSVTSEEELLSQIDEEIVTSYLPNFERKLDAAGHHREVGEAPSDQAARIRNRKLCFAGHNVELLLQAPARSQFRARRSHGCVAWPGS